MLADTDSREGKGFKLARAKPIPYNPVDLILSRGCPAGIAVASLNGPPKLRENPGGRKVIMRRHLSRMAIVFAALVLTSLSPRPGIAQQAGQAAAPQPTYTLPEYNAEQAAAAEKDPQARIKLLDAFVAQFPNSTLMGRFP